MKTNKLWLGILGVCLSFIIGLSAFTICDKVLSGNSEDNMSAKNDNEQVASENSNQEDENENNNINSNSSTANTNSNNNQYKEIDINNELVQKLWNTSGGEMILINGDDDAIIEAFYKNDRVIINNLSDEVKAILLEKKLQEIGAENSNACYNDYGCDFYYWSGNVVANTYYQIFGNYNSIQNKVIGCSHYQNDYSLYISQNCGDSVGVIGASSKLVKATQSDDQINLYQAVKFTKTNTDATQITYYKDFNKTNLTTETEEIEANYKRIFKKDNSGNYYFYSIEKL